MAKFIRGNPKTGAMLLLGVPMAVCAGIYFAMEFTRRKKATDVALHGGELVLQRLANYHCAQENMDGAEAIIKRLLDDKDRLPDLENLQSAVAKLEMTRREARAADMLKCAFENAEKERKSHEAYELQMLYTEMLIYMGEGEVALKFKCLEDRDITDARRPLFMAMIHIMSGNDKEGKKDWDEFREIRENLHAPYILRGDGTYNLANNFDEFKKIVELLQQDTKKASK